MSGDRHDMSDAEWEVLRSVLPDKHQGPERVHDRRNGIFFVLRTGTPWRDLRYGPYTTCFNRFNRWSKNGTWAWRSFKGLRAMMTGATMARRFICAWWTPRRCAFTSTALGCPGTTSLRKSGRGGRTTKVHLGENERVKTVFLTPGQAADCAQAEALLADLGRDGGRRQGLRHRRHLIETAGATAVIPSKSNRTSPRPLDREIYRMRNLVERFFGKIKEFRRVATRYDKELPLRRATGCQPILAPQNRKPII